MKTKISYLITSFFVFLTPIVPLMFTIGALILTDTITGIWKSVVKDGWKSITSKKLAMTVTKMFLYNLGILTGFAAETYMVPEVPMTRVAAGFIALVEVKSMWENIGEITGIDIWKHILKYVNNKVDKDNGT